MAASDSPFRVSVVGLPEASACAIYSATDDFGYGPVDNPVHMHDLHATLLHTLGLDHERLTYNHAGRDFRLTDVYGNVVHDILA